MEIEFIPLDYDYIDYENGSVIRIFGRTKEGKRCVIIDRTDSYFWLFPKPKADIEKYSERIKKISFEHAGRNVRVTDVKIKEKNFMGEKKKCLQVFVSNPKDVIAVKDIVKNYPETDEKKEFDINYVTRYIIDKNVNPLVWHKASGKEILDNEFGELDADIVLKASEIKESAQHEFKPKILAFDIEASELELGKGEILMISLADDKVKKVITWKHFKDAPSEVEFVKNEAELIERFKDFVKEYKPDFLVGYFSDAFDLPYLRARADYHKIKLDLGIDGSNVSFIRGILTSSEIRGIVHIDLYKFVNNIISYTLQSETLSLNDVAKELVGEEKLKIDLGKITKQLKEKSLKEDELKRFALYNLQDSILASKLFFQLWPNIAEMTKVVQEPLFDVSRASYSHLVEYHILHNLKEFNEIAESRPIRDEIEKRRSRTKYEGAYVFQPKPALYERVAVFDFLALYPSIIISFNISPSTIRLKKEKNMFESPELEINRKKEKFYFTKEKGFIPVILERLLEQRKKIKQQLKGKKDATLEARSYALKTLANATYGYLGFFGARYYSVECAASITAFGRHFIQEVIENAKKNEFNVIYGDSVGGDTKLIVKKNGEVYEESIGNLFEKKDNECLGKEYNLKYDAEVLTLDEGGNSVFKPINHVMRHKTDKKMYRINFTNRWYIDVTEDHSLMGYQATNFNNNKENKNNPLKRIIAIKPGEIKNKANSIISLKKIPYKEFKSKNYPKEVYEFIGYFVGDGSFRRNSYQKKHDKDYYLGLSLGSDKKEVLDKLILPLIKQGYIKSYWLSKTREGDLTINGLKLVRLISENLRSKEGKKEIPKWLFEENEKNIASFLRGLFSADGCVMIRNDAPIIKYTSIEDKYIEEVRRLLYRVGISHSVFKENSVNKYKDGNKTYSRGTFSKNIIIQDKESFCQKIGFILDRKNKLAGIKTNSLKRKAIKHFEFDIQAVKNIEQIKTLEYVYDIEVKGNHKFFANYVLVHNTDSIAIELGEKSEHDALKWHDKINSELPGTMELELENFYKRGIFVTKRTGEFGAKKKYALLAKDGSIKIRGFESVRRDRCELAKETQDIVLRNVLEDGNPDSAMKYVNKVLEEVKKKKAPVEKLIIRTQLKKAIEEYTSVGPHVYVAEKMEKAGIPVKAGALIEYVIAEGKGKLIRERAKLPSEVKEGKYDVDYYINHQILPAVESILAVFQIETKKIEESKRQRKLGDF